MAPQSEANYRSESALRRYWRAQLGSALFLITVTIGCAILLPMSGLFPDDFGPLRRIAAGGFIGFGCGMIPVAYPIWD